VKTEPIKEQKTLHKINAKDDPKEERSHQFDNGKKGPTPSEPGTIKNTAQGGDPVCLLCMRKFRSTEQLRRHKAASQLHKENLRKAELARKQEESGHPQPASSTTEYVDRANKRRVLYGVGGTAVFSAIQAPKKPAWLMQTGTLKAGINVAAELRNVRNRLDMSTSVSRNSNDPPRPGYHTWERVTGRRETPMTDQIRSLWDKTEK
jgi:hypothetical protein